MKLGRRSNNHKEQAALRIYANPPGSYDLCLLCDCGNNADGSFTALYLYKTSKSKYLHGIYISIYLNIYAGSTPTELVFSPSGTSSSRSWELTLTTRARWPVIGWYPHAELWLADIPMLSCDWCRCSWWSRSTSTARWRTSWRRSTTRAGPQTRPPQVRHRIKPDDFSDCSSITSSLKHYRIV